MSKIILFQGAILSKGRTFESLQNRFQNIEYSSIQDLSEFSIELNKNDFDCYFLFWQSDIKAFKNDIFFKSIDQSKIIPIPNIDFPRGNLKNNLSQKNKLFHYFAMQFGISYLITNEIVKDEDIIVRSRTDITFDYIELDKMISSNFNEIIEGKMLCQYWRKENTRWFIDFIFASNTNVMYNLYNKLYLNCLKNRDYAFSVHQDIIKTLATIYIPSYFIYREGPPKTISKKTILKFLKVKDKNSKFNFELLISKNLLCKFVKNIIKISFAINRLTFFIYVRYENLILYFIYKYFINSMSFKLQKSIIWRGGQNTNNYEEFKKENFNQTLIFSDINN